ESEKSVDAETIDIIKNNITGNSMFAWQDLPESELSVLNEQKTITFNFLDGQSITVTNNKALPLAVGNAFFNIELELTTKN
ncbi:MAG: hypothetical protein IJU45_02930, partial [Clostridia bacterium]|nr:hypothetical protein [Clostridia bacterium]